ncbi:hypothetical protein JOD52_001959 [Brachybacterium muris]|uniref:hypothetical protein n=1 Tax=Brachybacterium muris TaxID=219301 RepID=UPI00195EF030|nr:hypothetical protein [Brachybacterium muris]MBM7501119.1 hypothetical protein [Brachybacterium muris]
MIITSIFEVTGLTKDDDIKRVKGTVYDTPHVGAVAFEVTPERTLIEYSPRWGPLIEGSGATSLP